MSTEFTGAGDPRRSMELLWGQQERGKRGPKPRLSVDEIAQAAIALADADGVATLSMRRVAEAVGLSTMALYTYVPSKAELVDIMLDRVLGEGLEVPDPALGWRGNLEKKAWLDWERGQRHPWVLQVGVHRPPLGPNIMARYETTLSILDGVGLSDLEMERCAMVVMSYVQGAVRQAVEAQQVFQRTGVSDEQWWLAQEPWMHMFLDPARFPLAARVGASMGEALDAITDRAGNFDFGLQRVLDGIEAFIDCRRRESEPPLAGSGAPD